MGLSNTLYGMFYDSDLLDKIENEFNKLFGPNSLPKNNSLSKQTLSWTEQQLKKLQGFILKPAISLKFINDMEY